MNPKRQRNLSATALMRTAHRLPRLHNFEAGDRVRLHLCMSNRAAASAKLCGRHGVNTDGESMRAV